MGDKKKNSISDTQYAMTRGLDQSDRAYPISDNGEEGERNEGRRVVVSISPQVVDYRALYILVPYGSLTYQTGAIMG